MLSAFLAMPAGSAGRRAAMAATAAASTASPSAFEPSILSALLSLSTFRSEMAVGGLTFPLCTVVCYLLLLAIIKRAMKDRQAFDLKQVRRK